MMTSSLATRPVVTIDHAAKHYADGAPIIQDFSLSVAEGEFVSLLGASGCGKSTLLKLVAGLRALSGGSILIDGKLPAEARLVTSFVFQDSTLLPWRTVAGNVELSLQLKRVPAALRASRTAAALALVGLERVRSSFPRQLSGGMKMRVSLARALATTPRLLLMDEPFGALDELSRNRLNEEMLALRDAHGWTTLFVTHSISEAVFLSDRIILMAGRPGRVVQDIPVRLPAPRTAALRSEPAFLALVGDVSRALGAIGS